MTVTAENSRMLKIVPDVSLALEDIMQTELGAKREHCLTVTRLLEINASGQSLEAPIVITFDSLFTS